jgi:hypothetical protein
VAQSGRVGQVIIPKKSLEKKWKTHLNKKICSNPKTKNTKFQKIPEEKFEKVTHPRL